MKQARSSFVFVEAKCVTQSGFQCLILVFSGWLTNEIQHSCCCLLVERSKNLIILSGVNSNPAKVELGFSLCEPHLRLGRPKGK